MMPILRSMLMATGFVIGTMTSINVQAIESCPSYDFKINGCSDKGVNDKLKYSLGDYSAICDAHDRCYRMIGISRKACDVDFYNTIINKCHDTFPWWNPARGLCDFRAEASYQLIRSSGTGNSGYRNGQNRSFDFLADIGQDIEEEDYNCLIFSSDQGPFQSGTVRAANATGYSKEELRRRILNGMYLAHRGTPINPTEEAVAQYYIDYIGADVTDTWQFNAAWAVKANYFSQLSMPQIVNYLSAFPRGPNTDVDGNGDEHDNELSIDETFVEPLTIVPAFIAGQLAIF